MSMPRISNKSALALALASAMVFAAAAQAGSPMATVSRGTQLSGGDAISGTLPSSHQIHVTVALKLRNPSGLAAYNAKPHRPMSLAQLSANHLPTQAQAQAVAKFLEGAGFTHVDVSRNRMLVSADGTAVMAARAFGTSFVQVRTHDGRDSFANTADVRIPVSLRDSVQAVLGLQDVHQAHTFAVVNQQSATAAIGGHNPLEFADIYGASGLNPASGVDVGVWGWGSMAPSVGDLAQYESDNGLASTTTNVVCTLLNGSVITNDPTCKTSDQGSVEWDMDSQDIVAMSGGVNSLTFYSAHSGSNSQITAALASIITPPSGIPLASVVNASFGECERYQDSGQGGDGSAQADDALFQIGQAQGQTFSISSGDHGADECGDGGKNSASYPASSPYVIDVAGTTLNASSSTYTRETVWAASGGSPSSFESAPSWQSGLTYGPYKGARGPDVAFDANPSSGAIIYSSANGGYVQVGGTSLAAPIFAGAWTRLIANGVVDPMTLAGQQLYAFPATSFHDVRSGNNHGYVARPGWDWASGRGSLNLANFSAGP